MEILIINPRDSRKDWQKEMLAEEEENEEPTKRMSSNQAEFLKPFCLRRDNGTLRSLVNMRGAHVRPKTKALKQYRTPSKSKHKYL